MLIEGTPTGCEAPHVEGGQRRAIWVALLKMDDAHDEGLATGFYWRAAPVDAEASDAERDDIDAWRKAARNEQGPHRSAQAAIQAVAWYTVERAAMAARLVEAAEAVRCGQLDPGAGEVAAWLEEAQRMDKAAGAAAAAAEESAE